MLSLHQLALSFGSFGRNDPVIPEKPPPQCQGLKTTNFVPYFGYPGNLNVEGILTIYPEIGPDKSALLGAGHFSGVDPACSSGPNPDVNANSCGIHIHVGTSCGEDAGGHYYKTDADPWSAGYYATESDGTAEVAFALMPGTSSADITGKAVIVHDYDGDRIGCALLEMPMPDQVAAPFGKYFSVPADLSDYAKVISGAKISTTPEKTTIDYMVADVDPACAAGPDLAQSANSCGIHIHAGTSCEQDALGHYYAVGSDPWGEGYYTAQSATDQYFVYAAGKFSLKAGLDQAAITGKTLIVHDQAGDRTHCAPIHAPTGFLGVSTFTACPRAAEVGCALGVPGLAQHACGVPGGWWLLVGMMAHWLGAAGNALISARSALLACGWPCAERVSFCRPGVPRLRGQPHPRCGRRPDDAPPRGWERPRQCAPRRRRPALLRGP